LEAPGALRLPGLRWLESVGPGTRATDVAEAVWRAARGAHAHSSGRRMQSNGAAEAG